jgi:transmembrane sensor
LEENKNDIIEEIIVKHLTGEASVEESKILDSWKTASTENKKIFDDTEKVFGLGSIYISRSPVKKLPIDIENEWHQFVHNIDSEKTKTVNFKAPEKNNYFSFYKIAASILFLFVAGFLIYQYGFKNSLIEYQTAELTQEIILPDQSVITLNKFSTISYSVDFGKNDRNIKLAGEAFFEIISNKEKPFIIETEISQIKVLGTSFNVKAIENSAQTEVVVSTGIVQLSSNETLELIKLTPGEKGLLDINSNSLKSVRNENINYNAWKTKKIVFDRQDLTTVVETLNSVYNKNLSIKAGLNSNCEVTVTFSQQSLEAVLNVLKTTLDLKIRETENEVIILEAGC